MLYFDEAGLLLTLRRDLDGLRSAKGKDWNLHSHDGGLLWGFVAHIGDW